MRMTERTPSLLVALIIAVMILIASLSSKADEFNVYDERNHHFDEVIDGKDGRNGTNGRNGSNGSNGINGRDATLLSNNINYSRSVAVAASMGQIPALSHVGQHNHSGIGLGAANYNGENAVAIGLLHQENNRSYKATIGLSGSETIYGGGASWAFE